jgi:hypothetical protein
MEKQSTILIEWTLIDAGKGFFEISSCLFVQNGFKGPGFCLCHEDALDGLAVKGVVTEGMLEGHVDVIGVVGLLQPKDEAGMKAAVSRIGLLEPDKERLCGLSQGEEGLSDRFKSVADFV